MKIILTNDDGIDEPGLATLERLCGPLGETIVVAPATAQSGISHQLTEHEELRVEQRGPNRFAVYGTPADCARLALRELARDASWLIAGINAGANLGMDTYVSGTVAAAREATIHSCPALALSQYQRRFASIDWERCERRASSVLRRVLEHAPGRGAFWNANLPHPADEAIDCEIVECRLDPSPSGVRFEPSAEGFTWNGDYHNRPRLPGMDIDTCFGGRVALTRLHLSVD